MGDGYTNKTLAKIYLSYKELEIASTSNNFFDYTLRRGTFARISNLIAGSPISVPSFYIQYGSLEKLSVRGIGISAKRDLEKILQMSLEDAEKDLAAKSEKTVKYVKKPQRYRSF